jgi:hypothetical protein
MLKFDAMILNCDTSSLGIVGNQSHCQIPFEHVEVIALGSVVLADLQ